MNRGPFINQFTLGAQLEPGPRQLKRDMQLLKKNGFNQVSLQVDWAAAEPLEGQFDFSTSEDLIQHAAGLEMGVVIAINCAQAPGWLNEKYPSHSGAPCASFIRALVERLGAENVVAWNTWQAHSEGYSTILSTSPANARPAGAPAVNADPLRRPVFAHKDSLSLARGAVGPLPAPGFPRGVPLPPRRFPAWDDARPTRPARSVATLLNEITGVALTFDQLRSLLPVGRAPVGRRFQGGPLRTSCMSAPHPREDMRVGCSAPPPRRHRYLIHGLLDADRQQR
jgi:hypothetical protein